MRKCPYCAEEIQEQAVVCKHCSRGVPTAERPYWLGSGGQSYGPYTKDEVLRYATVDSTIANGDAWVRIQQHPEFRGYNRNVKKPRPTDGALVPLERKNAGPRGVPSRVLWGVIGLAALVLGALILTGFGLAAWQRHRNEVVASRAQKQQAAAAEARLDADLRALDSLPDTAAPDAVSMACRSAQRASSDQNLEGRMSMSDSQRVRCADASLKVAQKRLGENDVAQARTAFDLAKFYGPAASSSVEFEGRLQEAEEKARRRADSDRRAVVQAQTQTQAASGGRSGARAAEDCISGNDWFGCSDKDYFKTLVGYAASQDSEAFGQGLALGILTGKCVNFQDGEQVHITDTAVFSGLVELRRSGELSEYWTNIEAVK